MKLKVKNSLGSARCVRYVALTTRRDQYVFRPILSHLPQRPARLTSRAAQVIHSMTVLTPIQRAEARARTGAFFQVGGPSEREHVGHIVRQHQAVVPPL